MQVNNREGEKGCAMQCVGREKGAQSISTKPLDEKLLLV